MKGQVSAAPSGRALEELNSAFFMKIAPEGPKPPLWSLANFQVVFGNLTGEVARPTLWRGRPRPRSGVWTFFAAEPMLSQRLRIDRRAAAKQISPGRRR